MSLNHMTPAILDTPLQAVDLGKQHAPMKNVC